MEKHWGRKWVTPEVRYEVNGHVSNLQQVRQFPWQHTAEFQQIYDSFFTTMLSLLKTLILGSLQNNNWEEMYILPLLEEYHTHLLSRPFD